MQDAKQLQELLKEALQIIRISESFIDYRHPEGWELSQKADAFYQRALPFATLEVKPHE